jgi:N-acyl-L-homoserine lactone synthetase
MAVVTHTSPLTPEQLDDVFALRYLAFCVENRWEPENDAKREREPPDAGSLFVLAYEDGVPIGTLRLTPLSNGFGFIGRVVILRACKDRPAVRSELIRGLAKVSYEHDIRHWFGLMESWFAKAANSYGLSWEQIGPVVDLNGPRQFAHMQALPYIPNDGAHFQPFNPAPFSSP